MKRDAQRRDRDREKRQRQSEETETETETERKRANQRERSNNRRTPPRFRLLHVCPVPMRLGRTPSSLYSLPFRDGTEMINNDTIRETIRETFVEIPDNDE